MDKNTTGATDKDWADKSWLGTPEDPWQLIPPDVAGALILGALLVCAILDRYGFLPFAR